MGGASPLLWVEDLWVSYGNIRAVQGISLRVEEGQVVTLIGANGAGKSSTLRAISGLVPVERGRIVYAGSDLKGVPAHQIVERGIAHVPEGRGIFANLTVLENLRLATWGRRDAAGVAADLERVFTILPRLAERRHQLAATLSGGEQQMLALGRALMRRARLMLLDEPSMGLAPVLVRNIFDVLAQISAGGTTILLVEQNAHMALRVAHYAYVLETGTIALEGPPAQLVADERVRRAYLGG
ncbi:MAG: ABC transporter ATP-binding protein [Armatimonadota bacterium]|nr:ABC transporter ATP-binding protein [Armatimonadota bacterium]MDR7475939.1 ABC transporter ATP-binding protein [Armatimonadota bacterium]